MSTLTKSGVVILAAAATLAQAPAPQQPPPAAPQPQPTQVAQPTFRTEANYVRVDVYPTRNGAPVADLTKDDFEILEGGKPQAVEQFERIQIRAAGPQDTRIEPNTVAESRSMLENPRARVFVIFLDTYHVDVAASHRIRQPLIDALDRVIGPDDLVAVMTPEMAPTDMAFARKTTTIDGFLTRYWHWGERDRMIPPDPEDEMYGACYPNVEKTPGGPDCTDQNGLAAEMIDRRHEKRTIDALQDLVRYLRGVREERKAVLAISNGWLLFKPNYAMMKPLNCHGVPTGPQVQVDPRNGRPTTKSIPSNTGQSDSCDIDRTNLAQIDDDREFRFMLDEANRSNTSFYPIDPRGLAVFDTPIVRTDVPGRAPSMVPPSVDRAMLTGRLTSLRTLAENTDGLAIVDSNDLAKGLRRVVDDLSSYYLLGYYSSGPLDGKFHSITVKVKRPGIQVRARRGYLAATPAEVARAKRDANLDKAPTPAESETLAIESVLRPLSAFSKETSLRLRAIAGWAGDETKIWLVGEVGTADTWRAGAEADITLSQENETLATAHASVPAGARTFKVALAPSKRLEPGDYTINVRTTAASKMASSGDMVPLSLPAAPEPVGSMIIRKGPFTGLKEVPTADLRFRRSEQMRVEVPAIDKTSPTARLLDRTGKPMTGVPMTAVARDDADGTRWLTAQVPLFPLAPGDYIVEIASGSRRVLTPFRIVQ